MFRDEDIGYSCGVVNEALSNHNLLIFLESMVARTLRVVTLALIALLLPSLAFCADSEVRIGLLASLSGDVASIGEDCRRGYEMGITFLAPDRKIGDHTLVTKYGDHRGDGKAAVAEFQRLVNSEKVVTVLSHHSQPTMQISPIAKLKQIPLLGILAHGDFTTGNPYAWRFWPSTRLEARTLFSAIENLKVRNLAAVTVQDEYTLSLREHVAGALNEHGQSFVFDEQLLRSDSDFRSVIAALKRSNPDSIFVNLAVPQLGPFMKQLAELGVSLPIFGNVWFMTSDVQPFASQQLFEKLVFAQLNANKQGFADIVAQSYPGQNPSVIQYACFSAMSGLLGALKTVKAPLLPSSVEQALEKLDNVQMPDEKLPILNREVQFTLKLVTFRQGNIVDYEGLGNK